MHEGASERHLIRTVGSRCLPIIVPDCAERWLHAIGRRPCMHPARCAGASHLRPDANHGLCFSPVRRVEQALGAAVVLLIPDWLARRLTRARLPASNVAG